MGMVSELLKLLLRHGQYFMVYPYAFLPFDPSMVPSPSWYGIRYIPIQLKTSDDVYLGCYFLPQLNNPPAGMCKITPAADDALATVVMFHGNGVHMWDCLSTARDLYEARCNVLLVSYRGYGFSNGYPTEKGLQIDAQTALDFVLNEPHLSKPPIVLFGHSLGGAVAIDLASRNPSKIDALIVMNTFTSLPGVVRDWPLLGPLSFVCHQKWDSASKISKIPVTTPILMLSGERDMVVPPKHMAELWRLAAERGQKKKKGGITAIFSKRVKEETEGEVVQPTKDVFTKFERGDHMFTYVCPGCHDTVHKFLLDLPSPSTVQRPERLESDPLLEESTPIYRWIYRNGMVSTLKPRVRRAEEATETAPTPNPSAGIYTMPGLSTACPPSVCIPSVTVTDL